MREILRWLFDTSMGVPGPQGRWEPWLTVLFHGANLVMGLALLSIPLTVARRWRFRRDGVSAWQFLSVVAFAPAMGVSRLVRVLEILGPPYHLTTIADVVAAALTVYSAVALDRLTVNVLKLPSRAEIHALGNDWHAKFAALDLRLHEVLARKVLLREQIERDRDVIDRHVWLVDKREALDTIAAINALLTKEDDHDAAR